MRLNLAPERNAATVASNENASSVRKLRQGVATAFPDATSAAVTMLNAGGNAVDAAVAAAWALSVCEPSGSGLGGHTTALVRRADGTISIIEGASRVPMAATRTTVPRREQHKGRKAATAPSTPAVLGALSSGFGRFDLPRVIAPAIALAKDGFEWTALQRREARWCWNELSESGAYSILARKCGRLRRAGARMRQPLLARTLRRLASRGIEDFYHGRIASEIVRDMAENGGLIAAEDLAVAGIPLHRQPVSVDYGGCRLFTTAPPAGGVTLLQALKLAEALDESARSEAPQRSICTVLDAVYGAFAFRERWPLRPDEFSKSVRDWMLSDQLIAEMAEKLSAAGPRPALETCAEPSGETTHLCTADAEGNVVMLTQSIQSLFGAKVAHPELGFFYNNYLTTCVRHSGPNELAPGGIPRSNICPTLALDENNRPRLAIGAAGSRRIVSSVLQVIRRVLKDGQALQAAVDAPRGHALLNSSVWVERPALDDATGSSLEARYARVVGRNPHDYKMGCVQALAWDRDEVASAAADPRRDGRAWTALIDARGEEA